MTCLPLDLCRRTRFALSFPNDGFGAAERAEFHSYPIEEQEAVKEWHDALMTIATHPKSVNAGVLAVADERRHGWGRKNLRKVYDLWDRGGRDWRVLINGNKFPNARKPKYAPETEAWIRQKLLENQRVYQPAIDAIHAQWRAWYRTGQAKYAIPGFAECPPPDAGRLPRLLLEHHLRTVQVKIEPAVVEMVRYGSQAARAVLPCIPGTRAGVRWLEHVSADDVWLGVKEHVPPYGVCRVLQFGFWDLSCSYYLPNCFIQRPRTPKNDGSWDQLKGRDFLWAVALLLERNGWPLDWRMHLLVENGTATMSRAQAAWLYEVSEGQVIVGYNSMEGEFIAGWKEGARGNSRAKAGHEGFHAILKNEMGHLAGQTGKDRDHMPRLEIGREAHARKLDNLIVQLPPEARSRILSPYLTKEQVWQATFDALGRIHGKQDHQCEGFERVIEWRPRGLACEPLPIRALEDFAARNLAHVGEDRINEYIEFFDRPESRAERQARLSAEGRYAAPHPALMVPFYEDRMEVRKIEKDGSFRFERNGRKYCFIPPTPDEALPAGQKVVGFHRPDGEMLHLFSGPEGKNRRYLLSWPSEKKLRRDAPAEVKGIAFGRKQAFFDRAYTEVAKATAPQIEAAREADEQNAIVAAEYGLLSNVQRAGGAAASAVQGLVEERQNGDVQAARERRRRERMASEAVAFGKALAGTSNAETRNRNAESDADGGAEDFDDFSPEEPATNQATEPASPVEDWS